MKGKASLCACYTYVLITLLAVSGVSSTLRASLEYELSAILSVFRYIHLRRQTFRASRAKQMLLGGGLPYMNNLPHLLHFRFAYVAAFPGASCSMLGSILSNLLLVLGTAFFAGGVFSGKKQQSFSSERWAKPLGHPSSFSNHYLCRKGGVCFEGSD